MKLSIRLTLLICLLIPLSGTTQKADKHTLSGYIKDASTGEDLIGANLYVKELEIGNTSNVYGFYSLTLPEGAHNIAFSYLGYEDQVIPITLTQNQTMTIELQPAAAIVQEIVISAEDKDENVESVKMSSIKMDIETVKKMPALFGEVDIIRSIQLLPGVKSMGEASSGFYVRGGNADQNLVLLDEAPIYNASHMFGFFSSFNPDAIKDMQLYKGAMPSRYGGRLSSVLDIRMKEGNDKNFGLTGGLGTMMSRLAVEAPLGNNGSFMIAGRRSYLDVLASLALGIQGKKNEQTFYFYDLNTKGNYRIGDKDRIFLSGYFGRDIVNIPDEGFKMGYGNKTATLRWNHLFSPKLFSNLSFYFSDYDYRLNFTDELNMINWDSRLSEYSLKLDFTAYPNPNHTLEFGVQSINHSLDPGIVDVYENDTLFSSFTIENQRSLENAIYISDEWSISKKFKINMGLRASSLHNIGPHEQINLDESYEVVDTTSHDKGIYNSYYNFEPRLGLKYALSDKQSIKASYNRTAQYIQQASNGNTATPFDIWFTSTPVVKPQIADQYAVGYFLNSPNNQFEYSAEFYYKDFSNSIDFKERAQLFLNKNLEGEIRSGVARAYGAEFMVRKNKGRLSGWISYTYSKIEKQIAEINEGNWYNAKYDKPHNLNVVLAYELGKRVTLGTNFVYSSGGAVTFPTGRYTYRGQVIPVYSERNAERLPDFHRLDVSLTLKSKKNENRRFKSETVFSIYNLYGRKNAFAINFKQDEINPNATYAVKQSLFSLVPSVTWNFKF